MRSTKRKWVYCWMKKAQLWKQKMGQLPLEKVTFEQPPVTAICLDSQGPVIVEGAASKGTHLEVWLLLFVCQATGVFYAIF